MAAPSPITPATVVAASAVIAPSTVVRSPKTLVDQSENSPDKSPRSLPSSARKRCTFASASLVSAPILNSSEAAESIGTNPPEFLSENSLCSQPLRCAEREKHRFEPLLIHAVQVVFRRVRLDESQHPRRREADVPAMAAVSSWAPKQSPPGPALDAPVPDPEYLRQVRHVVALRHAQRPAASLHRCPLSRRTQSRRGVTGIEEIGGETSRRRRVRISRWARESGVNLVGLILLQPLCPSVPLSPLS